jgi:hypothetical protein
VDRAAHYLIAMAATFYLIAMAAVLYLIAMAALLYLIAMAALLYLIAMAAISTRASRGKRATCTVARAGGWSLKNVA